MEHLNWMSSTPEDKSICQFEYIMYNSVTWDKTSNLAGGDGGGRLHIESNGWGKVITILKKPRKEEDMREKLALLNRSTTLYTVCALSNLKFMDLVYFKTLQLMYSRGG